MASPRVTVVLATYNWSTVLPFSIASALEQTFTDFELLVVGDHCTDDSEEVVRRIGDPRVRWINLSLRTGHQSGPNNEGIRQARGEFIAYLGHDDLWLPHHLETLVAALDAGVDLAHSLIASIGPDGTATPWTLAPTGVMHRRMEIPWRDYRELMITPDLDLWERARAAGLKFAYVPRLTAIKLPAASRRDVYRERPCHEQKAWLERIRAGKDLDLFAPDVEPQFARLPSLAKRVARLLVRPWRWPGVLWRRMPGRKGAAIRRALRFKGAMDA